VVSGSIDQAVSELNLEVLAGRRVFLQTKYLEAITGRDYLVSSLRQHLAASGCLLVDTAEQAQVVVEARAGAVATTRHDSLVGIPQTVMPAFIPGMPSALPEIALFKKTVQIGVAKVAVFAYQTGNGAGIWQSGVHRRDSVIESRWYLGLGPYQSGDEAITGPFPSQPPFPVLRLRSINPAARDQRAPSQLEYESCIGPLPEPAPAEPIPPITDTPEPAPAAAAPTGETPGGESPVLPADEAGLPPESSGEGSNAPAEARPEAPPLPMDRRRRKRRQRRRKNPASDSSAATAPLMPVLPLAKPSRR